MRMLCVLVLLLALGMGENGSGGCLRIMFWNLENFFDYKDAGGGEADTEFSSFGSRHWGRKKFIAKRDAVAKAIMWAGGETGGMPDIMAMAEVEDRYVVRTLAEDTALRKCGYAVVHYDSPDRRGIDVALMYRRSALNLVSSSALRVSGARGEDTLETRDILLVEFELRGSSSVSGSERLAVLVNHHPSKYGGADTDWKRAVAMDRMIGAVDSLMRLGINNIVCTGDFNDTPENIRFPDGREGLLVNLARPLAEEGRGSIRYAGKWELIDMFMVSRRLEPRARMEILEIPFLMVRDNVHSGEKPFRTWSGPRYAGGVSDHCPIYLELTGL